MTAAPSFYPGFIADDLSYMELIMKAIDFDSKPLLIKGSTDSKAVMGMSLGAWYTLNLAALNSGEFDKYVVINPPVNLFEGLKSVDKLYRVPFNNRSTEEAKGRKYGKFESSGEFDWWTEV